MAFSYGPRTVAVPTRTMSRLLYDKAYLSIRLPALLRLGARSIQVDRNRNQPVSVPALRRQTIRWRDRWNTYQVLPAHLTYVRGGVRIWVTNPFTGKAVSKTLVVVKGAVVVR